MKWFVNPDTTRLSLTDGQWIDIKTRLTHGEREMMLAAMSPFVSPGEKIQLERKEIRTALVNSYLVGWSLTRDDGKPVQIDPDLPNNTRLSTIRSLSVAAFDAIHAAIDRHVDETKAGDEGNGSDGAIESSATSPSRASVTGVTNG